ncbi:MAG TPA: cytochrome c [Steroidobacteraceae bacterium]|nr:cytochrome c [Steroidobacteraceae bacterium]
MIKTFFLGVIVTIVAAAACVYILLARGLVPASADSGPLPLEKWAARLSLRATLASDAPKTPNPVPLTDASLIAGIQLYGRHCAICHGTAAGDASASPLAKGEYPRPPQLGTDGVEDDPEGWTYWKIDHGIRWTGMPSWRDTLSNQQMWTLALFLKNMNKLPPAPEQAWQAVTNSPTPPASQPSPASPSVPGSPPSPNPPTS